MKTTTSGRKIGNFFVSSTFDGEAGAGAHYHVEIKNLTTLPFDLEVTSQIPEIDIAQFLSNLALTDKWEASFISLSSIPSRKKCPVSRLSQDEFRIQVAAVRSKRAYWDTWDDEHVTQVLEIVVKD